MNRYELTGSGVGDFSPDVLATVAKQFGAKRVRAAYHMGLSNQPKTIRFSAADDSAADLIGKRIREQLYRPYMILNRTSLSPMLRAYGLTWKDSRS